MLPPTAAAISCGIIGLGYYAALERKRRLYWEQTLNFKLMHMNKCQDKMMDALSMAKAMGNSAPLRVKPSDIPAPIDAARRPLTRNSRRYDQIVCNEDIIMEDADRDIRATRPVQNNAPSTSDTLKPAKTLRFDQIVPKKKSSKTIKPADNIYYSPSLIKEFIENALKKQKIQIMQQPIMELPQRSARFYILRAAIETYGGQYLSDNQYMDVAMENSLSGKITTMLLNHTINKITHGSTINYVIPINSQILQSTSFMNTLLAFHKSHGEQAKQLTFAFKHDDYENMSPHNLQIMRALTRLQCSFMLTNLKSTDDLDIDLMHKMNIKMLSIPASYVAEKIKTPEGFHHVLDMRRTLESQSLRVVVRGIDSEEMLEAFASFAPRYVEGEYFSQSNASAQTHQPMLYAS
tara:strand:- start:11568 stop:12785 length:1218 start_codon:yes stop_codon:yes gene_type:complete